MEDSIASKIFAGSMPFSSAIWSIAGFKFFKSNIFVNFGLFIKRMPPLGRPFINALIISELGEKSMAIKEPRSVVSRPGPGGVEGKLWIFYRYGPACL